MFHFIGEKPISIVAIVSMAIYMVFAYLNGKQRSEIFNAYLYIVLVSFARVGLFL